MIRRLYRSRSNKIIGGVCGGLGDYLSFDPVFLRIIFIFLLTLTAFFPCFIAYLIAWAVIPEAPAKYKPLKYKKLFRSVKNRRLSGLCGGISEYFKVDATLIRIVTILLMFITGILPLLIAYIVGSLIVAERPGKDQSIEIEVD
jgi:phage shock protein PspC (stress-responsive transcriptional regulator)